MAEISRFELEKKVEYLETLVDIHHITTFEENVHRLELSINTTMRVLAAEFQAMEHDPQNQKSIEELIEFLEATIRNLKKFTHTKGASYENH